MSKLLIGLLLGAGSVLLLPLDAYGGWGTQGCQTPAGGRQLSIPSGTYLPQEPYGSMGGQARSANFVVSAPTQQIAQQMAQIAEQARRDKAIQWLGQELPRWQQPCPISITVTAERPGVRNSGGGATSFAFDNGRMLGMQMKVEGSVERLAVSVLPHEVTHTIFASYFQTPTVRWADEGAAVCSEDDGERKHHDQLCRDILNAGRAIPLQRLLSLRDYPQDVMALYAEGYALTSYLIGRKDRPTFLKFVSMGENQSWDQACQSCYGIQDVATLESTWLQAMRATKGQSRGIEAFGGLAISPGGASASATPLVPSPQGRITDIPGWKGTAVPTAAPPSSGSLTSTDTAALIAMVIETQKAQTEIIRKQGEDIDWIKAQLKQRTSQSSPLPPAWNLPRLGTDTDR